MHGKACNLQTDVIPVTNPAVHSILFVRQGCKHSAYKVKWKCFIASVYSNAEIWQVFLYGITPFYLTVTANTSHTCLHFPTTELPKSMITVLIVSIHGGWAYLYGQLHTEINFPASGVLPGYGYELPIPVLTGPGVEQVHWRDHYASASRCVNWFTSVVLHLLVLYN